MDLFGSMDPPIISGKKKYMLVIVDIYTRYTWDILMNKKSETLRRLLELVKLVQSEKGDLCFVYLHIIICLFMFNTHATHYLLF